MKNIAKFELKHTMQMIQFQKQLKPVCNFVHIWTFTEDLFAKTYVVSEIIFLFDIIDLW